ncbi:MAG: hypothetical protein WCJ41_18505 [Aestuariivirga sp.]|uniref:hypothetical protein n=1 Tax=Aestuariivirga sp. TaxID=2650926 RepID=UPI0030196597
MNLLKRSLILSCGASASALVLAINAGATDFTITPSPPAPITTDTQILDTTGNLGTPAPTRIP